VQPVRCSLAKKGDDHAEMLAISAPLLMRHVADAIALGTRCGVVGKSWSFSHLTGNAALQLDCGGKLLWEHGLADNSGLVGCLPFDAAMAHTGSTLPADRLAWVRGGTTMREIAMWAEGAGLSLVTSGDQLGPSLAGAVATGTHGSRLGYGGVQNMVRGMHVVTGPGQSVWIEPARAPVLSDAAVATFADAVIRDDAQFADALIHLGAMGVINGAVIELESKSLFDKRVPILKLEPIWTEWLDAVMARDFAAVAALLGCPGTPIFYEFSLNPFDPKGGDSVHILYFPSHAFAPNNGPGRTPRPADAVYAQAQLLAAQMGLLMESNLDLPSLYVAMVQQDLIDHPDLNGLPWSGLHRSDSETGERGALFNAGFAVPLSELPKAISTMCDAAAAMTDDRQFIFTYRFVTQAAGTLSHFRWDESVAIELDGASKLMADRFQVVQNSDTALDYVQAAFDANGVDYCMHWGKLGNNAHCVAMNFGDTATAGSPIGRWHRTRAALLPTATARQAMQNDVVAEYGMV
jgi:FAD/FMN-containing dehydrogenase